MTQITKASLKKTNIPWIWEIPENWEVRYVKAIFRELSIKNHPNERLLLASQSQWVIYKEEHWTRTTTAIVNLESLKLVEIWNFVISLRSFQGGIEIAYRKGIISPAYTVFSEYTTIDKSYYKYLFKDIVFIQMLNTMNSGIRDGQSMSFDDFKYKILPFPPLYIQTVIANFLDHKTTEIKKFIENKRKLIELLKEQKQSIIHRAVTKGINPDTKMKDSGIPWIGEIPEDWEIIKIKFLTRNLDWKRVPVNWSNRDEIRWVYPYYWATWILDYVNDFIFDGEYILIWEDWAPFFDKTKSVSFVVNWKIWVNNHCHVLENISDCYSEYIVYWLNSVDYMDYIKWSTRDKLNQSELSNIYIPLPSIWDQKMIIDFLQIELTKIDSAIIKIEQEITLIEDYQASLIYQAVTGKIQIQ